MHSLLADTFPGGLFARGRSFIDSYNVEVITFSILAVCRRKRSSYYHLIVTFEFQPSKISFGLIQAETVWKGPDVGFNYDKIVLWLWNEAPFTSWYLSNQRRMS